jgi:hypothetical protein
MHKGMAVTHFPAQNFTIHDGTSPGPALGLTARMKREKR